MRDRTTPMDPRKNESWLILTTRYGSDIRDPSIDDFMDALNEIFHESLEGMTEFDYAEHSNAWLRYGFDDGPMYVLDFYRNGRVTFGQWADQDYETELNPETTIENITQERMFQLWKWLASGEVDTIKAEMSASD